MRGLYLAAALAMALAIWALMGIPTFAASEPAPGGFPAPQAPTAADPRD